MKNYLLVIAVIILLHSCKPEAENKNLTYQNIIIFSDLSDRIEPEINGCFPNQQYPPKDIEEIEKILNYFKDECVKPGEKIGDRSCISFATFSSEQAASIDIANIKDIAAKQQFINSTGRYQNNGLIFEIEKFKEKVKEAYKSVRNEGLDLLSITIDKVENGNFIKEDKVLTDGIDTTFINFDNHIYIFTDGYLEYRGKSTNSQFYFGINEIEQIRKYCKENKVNIKTALEINREYCLPPIRNKRNKLVELHILETHERDKDTKLQKYVNPHGLRDNEILEEVWTKWARESGFKHLEWRKY